MSLTVEGGESPRQIAAIRGRELIRENRRDDQEVEALRKKWQSDFKALQEGGN